VYGTFSSQNLSQVSTNLMQHSQMTE